MPAAKSFAAVFKTQRIYRNNGAGNLMTKAAFLDRDGVINRKLPGDGYVTTWKDFQVLPGVVEAVARLNRASFYVIVVTNQRCIAKGLLTTAELDAIHRRMSEFFGRHGATINGVYYCPHEMAPLCGCRKPAPGMLLKAAREYAIELSTSWIIGDSDADIEAGRKAGCKTARLSTGEGSGGESKLGQRALIHSDIIAPSLLNAVRQILQQEKVAKDSFGAGETIHPFFQKAPAETKRSL